MLQMRNHQHAEQYEKVEDRKTEHLHCRLVLLEAQHTNGAKYEGQTQRPCPRQISRSADMQEIRPYAKWQQDERVKQHLNLRTARALDHRHHRYIGAALIFIA